MTKKLTRKERESKIRELLKGKKAIPLELFDKVHVSKTPKWLRRGAKESLGRLSGTIHMVYCDLKQIHYWTASAGYIPDPSNKGVILRKEMFARADKKWDLAESNKYQRATEEMNPWYYRVPNKLMTDVTVMY